jgi:hypothetical protein
MSIKSIFLSLSFVMVSAFATASGEVITTEVPSATVLMVEVCSLDATFTSGGTTYDVTVTAADCGTAAAGLAAIAKAIDSIE